jgi:putative selenate reductase
MAELFGVTLGTHLESIIQEYSSRQSVYGYPERKIYRGYPDFDFSVDFHGKPAATPLGPASGPHTQMAQNIILAFLGGGRIMELKTVQILDQLDIPRPCIDVRNIGFNVEWSQELRLQDSLREYIIAYVLLKIIEEMEILGIPQGDPFYNTIFDISVGYDLKGISSPPVHKWLQRIMNAAEDITKVLDTLPEKYAHLKKLPVDPHIANSATLSTFHGCPRDEIEAIVQHLISGHGLHVIVKMNPTLLGYEFARKTLHDDLGYTHIELDPAAFENDLQFEEGVAMIKRLQKFAKAYGKNLGAKFTNTLVVKNTESIFKDEVMYLSGPPLHVISMNAMHRFRSEMGDDFHISFSAGITKQNFADAVLCSMKPITTCTDLLKTGGYTRMFDYLKNLKDAMEQSGCRTIEEYTIENAAKDHRDNVFSAGVNNAGRIVPTLVNNPRYHYKMNAKPPKKIDSHLTLFDCITCNKCLPVCPNAANFSIPTGQMEITHHNFRYSQDGDFLPVATADFVLQQKFQIANLADFCNECGDCDTYCPEYGGPFIEKPRFFSSESSYLKFKEYDGFFFPDSFCLKGRIDKNEYLLVFNPENKMYLWKDGGIELLLNTENRLVSGINFVELEEGDEIDMRPYYIMRTLLDGILNDPQNYPALMLRKTIYTR